MKCSLAIAQYGITYAFKEQIAIKTVAFSFKSGHLVALLAYNKVERESCVILALTQNFLQSLEFKKKSLKNSVVCTIFCTINTHFVETAVVSCINH